VIFNDWLQFGAALLPPEMAAMASFKITTLVFDGVEVAVVFPALEPVVPLKVKVQFEPLARLPVQLLIDGV
jgi:hypothetical protein